ncbi:hypothetical protein GCK72_019092 [Caenorhabditis remanei]|uniref:CUB-like domain-containing protein n=1 Tax=Caenorhabditis remanei TaxID=31234 RepID=A0A6A5GBC8_CAERE|nr:hypothetical protein GCK72_019092 [Caenorhabditis remanei]KAF1752537.1 hypothetical protein GCK72_019092 [Caenorhabditis remanei]
MFLLAGALIFSTIFQLSHAQQIIQLSTFKGGSVDNKINVAPPYSLYVSAHMDTSIVLKQIYIKTEDGQMKNLDDLKNAKADTKSGLLTPFQVQSTAYISSVLADSQMAALEGFIYITTAKQAKDFTFKVYDVDEAQVIRTSLLICNPCTIVFLNSNTGMTPIQSSTISTWRQSNDSTVKLYSGVPTDQEEVPYSQIFANPIETINGPAQMIPIVEKFSVSLRSFYFKTTSDFYFLIQPFYGFNSGVTTTTGYTSTGLYMKSRTQTSSTFTVICVRDTRFNGTTGANIIGSLPVQNAKVTVQENDGVQKVAMSATPANQIFGVSTDKIGQNLTISSDSSEGGEFFVQYYILQDQEISSTYAPTQQPPGSIETTTKGSDVLSLSVVLVSVILFT